MGAPRGRTICGAVVIALLVGGCSVDPPAPPVDSDVPAAPTSQSPTGEGGGGGGGDGPSGSRDRDGRRARARVVRVIDGDTIEVLLRGRPVDVRLIGVDTPETVHPTIDVECFGPAASRFTRRHLEGRRVHLEFDRERRDPYGRTLAYVRRGGLFNRTLVARGFATVAIYLPNDRYAARLRQAQRGARRADRGLWGGCPTDR